MTPLFRRLTLAAACALAPAGLAADQIDTARFDLVMLGVRAGTLSFQGQDAGGRYTVTGRMESGGVVAVVRKVRYDGRAEGTVAGRSLAPLRYEETADTGRRQSESVMEWTDGVPRVVSYAPARETKDFDLDPAAQGGTIDPLTAMYAALRDVPEAEACNLSVDLFDGRRRSRVTLGPPTPKDGALLCAGEYRRVAGFPPRDMEEKTRFPFTLRLKPAGDGMMRVVRVEMDTLYGSARLIRR
ncbi:MAG: DUF3108 domain-containing protein [Rhodobacterales bacterium]|nr:DUF3108 domain-containing protein [Rhodobacterales bacterium]